MDWISTAVEIVNLKDEFDVVCDLWVSKFTERRTDGIGFRGFFVIGDPRLEPLFVVGGFERKTRGR